MGILNCTPDSFYDGGKYFDPHTAIKRGMQMIEEGADIIDIGGESTRPGSKSISSEEELARILPVVKALRHLIPLSIDTSKAYVAHVTLSEGATMINDVTGASDPKMCEVMKKFSAPFCLMHMQGTPQTMQINPSYPQGVATEICEWFQQKIKALKELGLDKDLLILDPGIGFGKTAEDNLKILSSLHTFRSLGFPLLIGLSRKSFMSKILGCSAQELLSTTIAMNTMCLLEGVEIIRVHDVKEHRMVIDAISRLRSYTCNPTSVSSSQYSKSLS